MSALFGLRRCALVASFALAAGGCALLEPDPGPLATSRLAADFGTYRIGRVAVLPFQGRGVDAESSARLQSAFQLELAQVMPYELVCLGPDDLAEVERHDPHRRGLYEPRTILELAERYRLDALLIGTVTRLEPYPPQALGLEIELVACETGLPLWSSSVQLDAGDSRVRARLERWQSSQEADSGSRESVQLTLVSPERFARYAAWEVARSTDAGAVGVLSTP